MVGERLAEVRSFRGDTQAMLAKKLGCSKDTVSSWEQGKSSPRLDTLIAICEMYDVPSDFLLGLSDEDPDFNLQQRQKNLTPSEQAEVRDYSRYLLWKRKHKK